MSAPDRLFIQCQLRQITSSLAAYPMAPIGGVNATVVSLHVRDGIFIQLTTDTAACIVKGPSSSAAAYIARSNGKLLAASSAVQLRIT